MSKHIPGPVSVDEGDGGAFIVSRDEDGGVIAIFYGSDFPEHEEANAALVAESFNIATETGMTPRQLVENRDYWKSCSHGFVLQRDEARAQRAELLAALKAVEESKGTRLLFDVRKKVRAAIAKAKGMDQ